MKRQKFNTQKGLCITLLILLIIVVGGVLYGNLVKAKEESNKYNSNVKYGDKYIEQIIKINKLVQEKIQSEISKENEQESMVFKITAYDLSVQSTGKTKSHPAYGISRSGIDLKGKTWEEARIVAVDKDIIPLGSKILIEFKDDKYKRYTGIYSTEDTGSSIKGYHIDLFLGDFDSYKPSREAIEFGITYADVKK